MALEASQLNANPFLQFQQWLDAAKASSGMSYPNAVCLSTVTPDGDPDGRIVLLRGLSENGLDFYTNSESSKGVSLEACPKAAMTFYWDKLQRQVRVRGGVTKVTAEESDTYFASRPRESQIGAWASQQSRPLENRATFEGRLKDFEQQFEGAQIVRPPHWFGFRLVPQAFEFWQEQPFRLHDRFLYTRCGSVWEIQRLYP